MSLKNKVKYGPGIPSGSPDFIGQVYVDTANNKAYIHNNGAWADTTITGTNSGTNTGDEVASSETVAGIIEIATQAEVDAATSALLAVTPAYLPKNNLAGTSAPSSSEDSSSGYSVGSKWVDTAASKAYICLDSTLGSAVWSETTQQASATSADTYIPLLNTGIYAGSTFDATTDSVVLPATTDTAVDFSFFKIPSTWDEVSDLSINLLAHTPTAGVGNMRLHADFFIVKDGEVAWSDAGYTSGTSVDIAITNQSTYQTISDVGLVIPGTNLALGCTVYFRLYREGSHANDTHADSLYVNSAYLGFTAAGAGTSTATDGFTSGGYTTAVADTIDTFTFASAANATSWGTLTAARNSSAGQSSITDGFASGGNTGASSSVIDTFTFASAANATAWGNLTAARYALAGQSSTTDGFTSGGTTGAYSSTIDAFAFSTTGNASAWGNLTVARYDVTGQSSSTDGFASGGWTGAVSSVIDAFTFASAANATAWGNLTVARYVPAGQSSSTDGFASGGHTTAVSSVIDTFTFASAANATAWGNLTVARGHAAGQQG